MSASLASFAGHVCLGQCVCARVASTVQSTPKPLRSTGWRRLLCVNARIEHSLDGYGYVSTHPVVSSGRIRIFMFLAPTITAQEWSWATLIRFGRV